MKILSFYGPKSKPSTQLVADCLIVGGHPFIAHLYLLWNFQLRLHMLLNFCSSRFVDLELFFSGILPENVWYIDRLVDERKWG